MLIHEQNRVRILSVHISISVAGDDSGVGKEALAQVNIYGVGLPEAVIFYVVDGDTLVPQVRRSTSP